MLKAKTYLQIWELGVGFEFNIMKWKLSYSINENQHSSWFAVNFGPFTLNFLWDYNLYN